MIQLVIYVTTLTIGGIDKKSFLAVSSATNDTFGQKVQYKLLPAQIIYFTNAA